MEEIRNSKEYKTLERALLKRLKDKLNPNGKPDQEGRKKAKPDAVIKDLVQRYMNAWTIAQDAQRDIEIYGHYCTDDRGRRYSNPALKSLSDAERLMSQLLKDMEIKTEDLAASMEEDDDDL